MRDNATDTYNSFEERYLQEGTALRRIFLEAPYLPRCSDDKTATRVRPREYAIRYPYMQINRPGFVSWLIFDLDHAQSAKWEDANLPAPNLIVRNRQNGHSHYYYAIPPVCTTEAARAKPIAYMKAVYEAFAARLDADPEFHSGPVAKTPGHSWWDTQELHSHVYELGELADYVDLTTTPPWQRQAKLEEVSHSRHCTLFEELRHYAYAIVNRERSSGSFDSFIRFLEAYAYNLNSASNWSRKCGKAELLPLSSLRATVKSIARWTWERYTGSGRCHRGVMQLDPDLAIAERQRLAACRTHGIRQKATESKVRAACRQLWIKGQKITQTSVSRLSGLARQTVANYKHILTESIEPIATAIGRAASGSAVKYGAHQVTAGFLPGVAFGEVQAVIDVPDTGPPIFDG